MSINHPDHNEYRHFTGRQRSEKAISTLYGIIEGITIDDALNTAEIAELLNWCKDHSDLKDLAPFNELIPMFDRIMADGVIDVDEQEDLLWLCKNLSRKSEFYDSITVDLQVLQGILHGVSSDGIVSLEEATNLQKWINRNSHLKGTYPYDELDSILIDVLADKRIDEEEHEKLLTFFDDFSDHSMSTKISRSRGDNPTSYAVKGVCATCPELNFEGKTFVFTGTSNRGTKAELGMKVKSLGGLVDVNVSQRAHFLVINSNGNPCWAYSCHGRKVEKAVEMRKSGHPIIIVHESDFWDAIEDFA